MGEKQQEIPYLKAEGEIQLPDVVPLSPYTFDPIIPHSNTYSNNKFNRQT